MRSSRLPKILLNATKGHGSHWKQDYPIQGWLASYRSQSISILEYRLGLFKTNAKLSAKVDLMINRHMRSLLGKDMTIYRQMEVAILQIPKSPMQ